MDTVTVTPSANGCAGASTKFIVQVNPTPSPNAPVNNGLFCTGATAPAIPLTSLDTTVTYTWTSSANVGFGTSGTGNIPVFTATGGLTTITATVNVVGTSVNGCISDTSGFTVTVYPLPVVTTSNAAICTGTTLDLSSLGSPAGGTWSGAGVTN